MVNGRGVEFDVVYNYSLFEVGIVVDVVLSVGGLKAYAESRIDTGSTYCIFERHIGNL